MQMEKPDREGVKRVEGAQGLMKFVPPPIKDVGSRIGHSLKSTMEKVIVSPIERVGNRKLVPPIIRGGGRPVFVP